MDGASKKLNGTMGSAQLQTGRLGNAFAGLAGQLTGVHPIIGNVAGVLGNFAVGSALTVGVLGGLAAIALAWDTLTKSAREAGKAQESAVDRLLKAGALAALGPGGEAKTDIMQARGALVRLLAEGTRLQNELDANIGQAGLEGLTRGKIAENQEAIARVQAAIRMGGIAQEKAETKDAEEKARKAEAAAAKLAAAMKKAAEEAGRYAQYMYEASKWTALTGQGLATTTLKAAQVRLGFKEDAWGRPAPDFTPEPATLPNVSITDGLTKKQLRVQEQILNADALHTARIEAAVLDSAQIIGNAVMQALNVGGGGRGSQIGGMIGSGLGMVAGSFLGPSGSVLMSGVGKVLGSVVGGIAGSLLGGLFDSNKKAVNENTNAVNRNTAALLLYAPAGFKAESYRYDAADPKRLDQAGREIRWNASRGGANPLLGT